jgi:catechol 2,3-dioxygenase-like lactoylglutathione lyase family enzyme
MNRLPFLIATFILLQFCDSKAQTNFSSQLIGVGVVVSDMEKSLDFYTNAIGMVKTGGFSLDADFAKRSGLTGGVPFDVVVLKLEDSPLANEWKLMSFGQKAGSPAQEFIQEGTRMQYITIHVKNLQPIVDRLSARGVKFLGETPTPLDKNRFFLFVQDPDGTFVELIGPMH